MMWAPLLLFTHLFHNCFRADKICLHAQKTAFWALFSRYSIPRAPLKGLDGATNDSRRAPKGPIGPLSTTTRLLGARRTKGPRGIHAAQRA